MASGLTCLRARGVVLPWLGAAMLAAGAARQPLWANPTGGAVVAGGAVIQSAGNITTIQQSTDRAVIHWQGFSIAPGETTAFVQPSASAAVLNRVTSGDSSQILGNLQANGQVYLLNPNGIYVGPGATVNVNSFLATTHQMDEEGFMRGADQALAGVSAAGIHNAGTIRAEGGDVYLVARNVENSGTIEAPAGTVGLMAGTKFYLQGGGHGTPAVRVDAVPNPDGGREGTGVGNTGVIRAVQARLEAAGNLYALAVSQRGIVQATGVTTKPDGTVVLGAPGGTVEQAGTVMAVDAGGDGGEIVLRAGEVTMDPEAVMTAAGAEGGRVSVEAEGTAWVSGQINAAGTAGRGGGVTVTAARVGLRQAEVEVSGETGGGTVLLGGDFQGKNPAVRNAERAFVSADSVIRADAVTEGDGGKVITWSDHGTLFYGEVSARGGTAGGDGGLVEVSGRDYLDFQGWVDTRAPRGETGTLWLDPLDLTINDAGPDNNLNSTVASPFSPVATPATLTWATINAALAGGNVTVTTVGTPIPNPTQDGNITTASAVPTALATAGHDLFLVANGDIILNGSGLTLDGGGSLYLQALGTLGDGDISIGQAVTVNGGGGLILQAARNIAFNGAVTVTGDLAAISQDLTGGAITDTAARTITGSTTLQAGTVTLDVTSTYTGAVSITARGASLGTPVVQINAAGNLLLGTVEILNSGTFVVPAGLTVTQTAGGSVVIGAAVFSGAGGPLGDITLPEVLNDFNSFSVLEGAGLTLADRDGIRLDATTLSGNLNVTTGSPSLAGGITQEGVLNITGTTTLAAFGDINLSNPGNGLAGLVTVNSADNLSLGNLNTLTLDVNDPIVDLTLSVGDIVFAVGADPVIATGVVTFQGIAAATPIRLNNPVPAVGELNLSDADLAAVADGATRLVFGRSDQTGDLTVFAGTAALRDAAEFRAGTGAFTVDNSLTVGGAMTVTADTITLSGGANSVTVNGLVTLQPFTPSRTIGFNAGPGAADMDFSAIPGIVSGETAFVFGRTDQTGPYVVGTTTFGVPVTFRTASNLGQVGLNGTLSTTGNALNIQGNLLLTGISTLISAGAITVTGDVDGAFALTVDAPGAKTLGGDVGNVTPLASLSTLSTVAGGTTRLGSGTVITSGNQTYGDQVVLSGNTAMSGTTATFASGVNGGVDGGGFDLTLNFSGTTTIPGDRFISINNLTSGNGGTTILSGSLTTAGNQTFSDAVALSGSSVTLTPGDEVRFQSALDSSSPVRNTSLRVVGDAIFERPVGGGIPLRSLDVSETTTVGVLVGTVTTSGAQTYGSTVALGEDTTFEGTQISLPLGTISGLVPRYSIRGAFDVVLDGDAVFNNSLIGSATDASITPTTLTVTGGSTFNGEGRVRTIGTQDYSGDVTVGGNQVFQATTVNFGGSLDGIPGTSGSVSILGNAIFTQAVGNQVTLGSLAVEGTSAINGGRMKTTGAQSYLDPVTLGSDTIFTTTDSAVTFGSTIENPTAQALTILAGTGTVTLGGAVGGGGTALSSLAVTGGTIAVNGGAVSTTGSAGQVYTGAVTLGADTTLTTANDPITFSSTIRNSAARALTILAGTATVTFGGAVGGGGTALGSLAVTGGTIAVNGGGVSTTGAAGQVYTGAVTLGANTTLTTTDDLVTFISTIRNSSARALTILAGTGTVTFGDEVGGGGTALGSLAVTGGTIAVNTTAVTTSSSGGGTGNQSYSGAVTLGTPNGTTVTLAAMGGTVAFSGVVNATTAGQQGLAITGNASLGGIVGGTALRSLSVSGTTALNTTVVTTSNAGGGTGNQSYAGAVTLGTANDTTVTLTVTGGTVTFGGGINATTAGEQGLAITGNASFGGAVGGTALRELNVSGTTALNTTAVTTSNAGGGTGNQGYTGAVTLGANTTLTGTTVNLGVVDGPFALTLVGNTVFTGALGGTAALGSLSVSGTSAFGAGVGSVRSGGNQSYGGAATLGGATSFVTTGSGTVSFGGTLGGGFAATVVTAGGATFSGLVSDPLSVTAGGAVQLGPINTAGTVTVTTGGLLTLDGSSYTAAAMTLAASSLANLTGVAAPFVNGGVTILTDRPNNNSPSSLNAGFSDLGYSFLPAPQVNFAGAKGTIVYRFFDAPGVATELQYVETGQLFAYTAAVPVTGFSGPRAYGGEVVLGPVESMMQLQVPGQVLPARPSPPVGSGLGAPSLGWVPPAETETGKGQAGVLRPRAGWVEPESLADRPVPGVKVSQLGLDE